MKLKKKINKNSLKSFTVDVFIQQKWRDFRLRTPRGIPNGHKIVLDENWKNALWKPSIHFKDARSGQVSNVISPSIYVTITNRSQVFMAAKLSLELNCDMHFAMYPFDKQQCSVELGSCK